VTVADGKINDGDAVLFRVMMVVVVVVVMMMTMTTTMMLFATTIMAMIIVVTILSALFPEALETVSENCAVLNGSTIYHAIRPGLARGHVDQAAKDPGLVRISPKGRLLVICYLNILSILTLFLIIIK